MDPQVAEAISAAKLLCPQVSYMFASYTINVTVIPDPQTELPQVLCEGAALFDLASSVANASYTASCTIAVIGVLSACLSLLMLSSKECKEPSFIYHRVVNLADLFYMLLTLVTSMGNLYAAELSRYPAWFEFTRFFGGKLDKALPDFIELLVGWMAVERASCLYQSIFQRINRSEFARSLSAAAFAASVVLNVPLGFSYAVDYSNDRPILSYSGFGTSPGYTQYINVCNGLFIVRAVVIAVGSVATIVVLMTVQRRKRRLLTSNGTGLTGNDSQVARNRAVHALCALQLCEATPLVITCCMSVALRSLFFQFSWRDFVTVPIAQSLNIISYYRMALRLKVTNNVIQQSAHALHFILYVIFVKKFRSMVLNRFRHHTAVSSVR